MSVNVGCLAEHGMAADFAQTWTRRNTTYAWLTRLRCGTYQRSSTGLILAGHQLVLPISLFGRTMTLPSSPTLKTLGKRTTRHLYGTTKRKSADSLRDSTDPARTMDPCLHPELTHTMGFLSAHGKGPGPTRELYPVMAMCKTALHSDVLGVSTEWWIDDVGDEPAWADKDDRLLWRGKNTGIYFKKGVPWSASSSPGQGMGMSSSSRYIPAHQPRQSDQRQSAWIRRPYRHPARLARHERVCGGRTAPDDGARGAQPRADGHWVRGRANTVRPGRVRGDQEQVRVQGAEIVEGVQHVQIPA